MFLQNKQTGTLVEVLNVDDLVNPVKQDVRIQVQEGQEEQNPEPVQKAELVFPSGEKLPRCWLDANYRTA